MCACVCVCVCAHNVMLGECTQLHGLLASSFPGNCVHFHNSSQGNEHTWWYCLSIVWITAFGISTGQSELIILNCTSMCVRVWVSIHSAACVCGCLWVVVGMSIHLRVLWQLQLYTSVGHRLFPWLTTYWKFNPQSWIIIVADSWPVCTSMAAEDTYFSKLSSISQGSSLLVSNNYYYCNIAYLGMCLLRLMIH